MKVRLVFEDNSKDKLSTLFQTSYSQEVRNRMSYSNGNGNLEIIARELLEKTKEVVCVYLDAPPDNKKCRIIYDDLKELSVEFEFRLVVLPIPCAEYYFIKAIQDLRVFQDKECVKACVEEVYYRDTRFYKDNCSHMTINTFEQFCKALLSNNVIRCLRREREFREVNNLFYRADCKFPISDKIDTALTLKSKSLRFVSQYPCIPYIEPNDSYEIADLEGLWRIHRLMVDRHNTSVRNYKEILKKDRDKERCVEFEYIK